MAPGETSATPAEWMEILRKPSLATLYGEVNDQKNARAMTTELLVSMARTRSNID